MPFARCSTSSDVPPQTSRMSKAEYAVTSCQPGLEHPNSKWSMSTCSWCCATIAQHKEGGWRARDERVRKRSGRREGRMQHVTYLRSRSFANRGYEKNGGTASNSDPRQLRRGDGAPATLTRAQAARCRHARATALVCAWQAGSGVGCRHWCCTGHSSHPAGILHFGVGMFTSLIGMVGWWLKSRRTSCCSTA